MIHFGEQKPDFAAVFFQRFPLFVMVGGLANASHAGSKKQKFQKVLIHAPEANLAGFFNFFGGFSHECGMLGVTTLSRGPIIR